MEIAFSRLDLAAPSGNPIGLGPHACGNVDVCLFSQEKIANYNLMEIAYCIF